MSKKIFLLRKMAARSWWGGPYKFSLYSTRYRSNHGLGGKGDQPVTPLNPLKKIATVVNRGGGGKE